MHPTVIGLVLLPCSLAMALRPVRLLQLALIAAVFQAAAAFVLGGFGLQPGLVPGLLLIAYVITQYGLGMRYSGEAVTLRTTAPLLALLGYALLSVVLLPDVFAGRVMVAPQKLDAFSLWLVPLAFTSGNITQPMYLAINVVAAVAVGLVVTRPGIPYRRIVEAYLLSGYIVVALVFWELLARVTGAFFPRSVLYSNPGWMIADQSIDGVPRLQGPFSEPAGLALYLSGLCFCCLLLTVRGYQVMRPQLLLALAAAATLLSTSTTGIVCLIMEVPAAMAVAGWRADRRSIQRLARTSAVLALAGFVMLGPVLVLHPGYLDSANAVIASTLSKGDSSSFADRTAVDSAALATVGPTYGLGVGWGSFRASSFVPGLLANGGVFGVMAVLWLVMAVTRTIFRAVRAAPEHPGRIVIDAFAPALCGQLAAALLSAPTIDSMAFFVQLGCLVGAAARMSAHRSSWSTRRGDRHGRAGAPAYQGPIAARYHDSGA